MSITLIIFLAMAFITSRSNQQTLTKIFEEKEQLVRNAAQFAETKFASRCSLTSSDCTRQSYLGCQSRFPTTTCDTNFDIPGCSCAGLRLDVNRSSVWIPRNTVYTTEVTDQICYTQSLEPFWKKNHERFSWADLQYVGTYNGVFRVHPALPRETCGTYDPRFRPWYVAASSGPKDVVIVLDISGSMGNFGRLDLLKGATNTVLSTLTIADYVEIVVFNEEARVIDGATALKIGEQANLDALKSAVNSLTAQGGTNFEAAFTTAFNLLTSSAPQDGTSSCSKAILFLTDGKPTVGSQDAIYLSNLIRDLNRPHNAKIFTYSLGSSADHDLMKSLACSNKGLWQSVVDGGDLRSQMGLFYDVLAAGRNSQAANGKRFTTWVEPYQFATGSRIGTTVATPIHDHTTDPPTLIGVLGTDLEISDMQQIEPDPLALLERLKLRVAECLPINLTECQLESIRSRYGVESTCGTCASFVNLHPQPCAHNSYPHPTELWANVDGKNESWSERSCCAGCAITTSTTTSPANSSRATTLTTTPLSVESIFTPQMILLLAVVTVVLLITASGYLYDRCFSDMPEEGEEYLPGNVVIFGWFTFNTMTDVSYAWKLYSSADGDTVQFNCFLASSFFLLFPFVLSFVVWVDFIKKRSLRGKDQFKIWEVASDFAFILLSVLSGSVFGAFQLCNSRLFGLPLFDMGLSREYQSKFLSWRWLLIVFEDIPQVIIQTCVLAVVKKTIKSLNILVLAALVASILSIVIGSLDIYWKRARLKSPQEEMSAAAQNGSGVIGAQVEITESSDDEESQPVDNLTYGRVPECAP